MTTPQPPRLARRPLQRTCHSHTWSDPYEWLRKYPDTAIAQLVEENAYAAAATKHLDPLRDRLYREITRRVREDDASVATRYGKHWYYTRTRAGAQYAALYRCPVTDPADRPKVEARPLPGEQCLIDGDAYAREHHLEFFGLGSWEISPDETRIVFTVDGTGDEEYLVVVTEIASGKVVDDRVDDAGSAVYFLADGEQYVYLRNDEAWRSCEVWLHRLGQDPKEDVRLFREDDERYRVDLSGDTARRYVFVSVTSRLTSEWHLIDTTVRSPRPQVIAPRREGVTYDVDLWGDELVIVHDADHKNGSVSVAAIGEHDPRKWREVLAGSDERRLTGLHAFRDCVVLSATQEAQETLLVLPRIGTPQGSRLGQGYRVDPGYEISSVWMGANFEDDSPTLLIHVESGIHPPATFELTPGSGELAALKETAAPGHDPQKYREWREWAEAPDGTKIPMTLLARADVEADGSAPAVLHGYGAYEATLDASFDVTRFPLLDRGVVYAIAHVRGGGEMGRAWWEQGSMEHKETTFTDFLACADHLVEAGWCAKGRLAADGASAGGLLMGAVMNMAPEKFAIVRAGVPFVDVLTTMLDPDLPLTVNEWEEWGDPLHDARAFARLRSYSPYENIRRANYPAVLATTSLHDARVSYLEPLKWVTRLRDTVVAQEDHPIYLRCEMDGGHGGPSGRYAAWREDAWELAVVLDALDATEVIHS